jgi:chromatin segregation and condensation protein Rec8/ScpA/Scc1 (kleisin family)
MTLSNPIEAALNPLHEALRNAADHARDFAELAEDVSLVNLLRTLADRHAKQAGKLERMIRKAGLPKMPDPERQLIARSLVHLKARLTGDRHAALVKAQQAAEQEIVSAGSAAMQTELPKPARQLIARIIESVVKDQGELAQSMPD